MKLVSKRFFFPFFKDGEDIDMDKVELEENLKERVKFTTQTVSKLITNYERFKFYIFINAYFLFI